MADIETAFQRLERALDRAEQALVKARDARSADNPADDLEAMRAERDRLAAEIALLRDAREEDAKLRAEAAEAVKSALSDLRGLVRREERVANA